MDPVEPHGDPEELRDQQPAEHLIFPQTQQLLQAAMKEQEEDERESRKNGQSATCKCSKNRHTRTHRDMALPRKSRYLLCCFHHWLHCKTWPASPWLQVLASCRDSSAAWRPGQQGGTPLGTRQLRAPPLTPGPVASAESSAGRNRTCQTLSSRD